MEFPEKLQELRKQKGMTQEELAQSLYVSRTAVSKWESGRGYPNIDSLKAISKFFHVTIDDLLSGGELLTLAEENQKQTRSHFRDFVFGSLDVSTAALFFLPFFGQAQEGFVAAVPLLSLTEIAPYLKTAYLAVAAAMVVLGILTLALQNCAWAPWQQHKHTLSLLFNLSGVLLMILSSQPYAAVYLFLFLAIKAFLLTKKQ